MFKKYMPLINSYSKKYYALCKNKGIDFNDLIQEGMVGLSYAINTFKEQRDTLFFTYASTCIERRILSCIRSTNTLKNKALNDSLSFESTEDYNFDYVLKDNKVNPENVLLEFERTSELKSIIDNNLTNFEKKVLEYKISGFIYKEIADFLNTDVKSIDNAIQRIRKKLKNYVTR